MTAPLLLILAGCEHDMPPGVGELDQFVPVDLAADATIAPDMAELPPDLRTPPGPPPVFQVRTSVTATTAGAAGLATGDFNGDGTTDVAVAGANIAIHVAFAPEGNLSGPDNYAPGGSRVAVATGDINGDTKLDVVFLDATENATSVKTLLGDGMAMFTGPRTYKVPFVPHSVALADVDRDGKLDAVVGNVPAGAQGMPGYAGVLLGDGTGTWQLLNNLRAGQLATDIAVADLNGDQWPDILVIDPNQWMLNVLMASGKGAFMDALQPITGGMAIALAAADLNGDQYPDVVLGLADGTTVLLNRGDGTLQQPVAIKAGKLSIAVVSADFNHDRRADIALLNRAGDITLLTGVGDGTFLTPDIIHVVPVMPAAFTCMAVGDLDGDHLPDLVLADIGGRLHVLVNRTP